MHVVFLAFDTVIRRPLKLDVIERVNIIYSNAAALVIPLVQALLGSEYVVYSCAFVIVQLILLWTHASACLQGSTKLEWKKILTNVNLIAIVAGALLYLLHISLPAPIVSTLSSVGNMIGPMGMLLAGMAIAEVPLKRYFAHCGTTSCCASSAGGSCIVLYYSGWYMSARLDFRWQGNFDDSLSLCHHTLLCNCHFHGSAVQS